MNRLRSTDHLRYRLLALVALATIATSVQAQVINNYWPDGDNIVMDDVLLPAASWSAPAQGEMAEWNYVDTSNNSHPFRISNSPQFSFGADDGDNTIGFLGEAGLNSEYGLSFSNALAWAVCWKSFWSGRYNECDVILDSGRSWSLSPHDSTYFRSTVLHELGHVRGLGHYNAWQSIENSGQSKHLRGETTYMVDRNGVRANATNVSERDFAIYNKWHNGSVPRWMKMSPTTIREGQQLSIDNISVENKGTLAFGSTLTFGVYLSTNTIISTADQRISSGSWGSYSTNTASTFDWTATIPTQSDCSTRYVGGIVDYNGAWTERYEGNNAVIFTNGDPYVGSGNNFQPDALTILLAEDSYEPNDSRAAAPTISLPFSENGLTIDQDAENDYFRMVVSQAGTIDVHVDFAHSLGNVNLALYSSGGSLLASSLSTTNDESLSYHAQPGTYYVRVWGTGTGSCNHYDIDVTFDKDLADLTVTTLSAPRFGLIGGDITFANGVKNIGPAAAGAHRVGFYLSQNTICSGADVHLGSRNIGSITSGATHAVSTTLQIPPGTVEGAWYLCAWADDLGAVEEDSNSNNKKLSAIVLTSLFFDPFETGDMTRWSSSVP